jgi:hypothetical protein
VRPGAPAYNEDTADIAAFTFPNRRRFLGMTALAAASALLGGCEDPKPSDAGFVGKSAVGTPLPPVDAVTALNTVLAVEHRAIFTYLSVTHFLSPALAATADGFRKDHEEHRDALSARISALGGAPAPPKTTYDIAPAPTDQASALKALAALEDTAGKTDYRMLAGSATGDVRAFLMTIMSNEAQHSAILLGTTGQTPIPAPFQSA